MVPKPVGTIGSVERLDLGLVCGTLVKKSTCGFSTAVGLIKDHPAKLHHNRTMNYLRSTRAECICASNSLILAYGESKLETQEDWTDLHKVLLDI